MLGALPDIRFSGTDASGWYIPEAKEAMENGSISTQASTANRIMSGSSRGLRSGNRKYDDSPFAGGKRKVGKFRNPGACGSFQLRRHPLGRTEWIRLYGVLTGKEKGRKRHLQSRKRLCSVLQKKVRMRRTQAGRKNRTDGTGGKAVGGIFLYYEPGQRERAPFL